MPGLFVFFIYTAIVSQQSLGRDQLKSPSSAVNMSINLNIVHIRVRMKIGKYQLWTNKENNWHIVRDLEVFLNWKAASSIDEKSHATIRPFVTAEENLAESEGSDAQSHPKSYHWNYQYEEYEARSWSTKSLVSLLYAWDNWAEENCNMLSNMKSQEFQDTTDRHPTCSVCSNQNQRRRTYLEVGGTLNLSTVCVTGLGFLEIEMWSLLNALYQASLFWSLTPELVDFFSSTRRSAA